MNQIIWLVIMVGAVGYIAGFVTMAALAVGKRADYNLKIMDMRNRLKDELEAKERLTQALKHLRNKYKMVADDFEGSNAHEKRKITG